MHLSLKMLSLLSVVLLRLDLGYCQQSNGLEALLSEAGSEKGLVKVLSDEELPSEVLLKNVRRLREIQADLYGPDAALSKILPSLSQKRILFVPGLRRELYEQRIPAEGPVAFGGYFQEQIAFLKSRGIEVLYLETPSSVMTEETANVVIEALLSSEKPDYLVGHSAGGLAVVMAALAAFEDDQAADGPPSNLAKAIRSRVAGIISLNAPYRGTPTATKLRLRLGALAKPTAFLLNSALQTDERNIEVSTEGVVTVRNLSPSLAPDLQTKWLEANQVRLNRLLGEIPVISVGAFLPTSYSTLPTPPKLPSDVVIRALHESFVEEYKKANDGLVALESQLLPGAAWICVAGSHASTCMADGEIELNEVDLLMTLLILLEQSKLAR